jgi:NADPH-dependent 7-cyano-7-deazaguanine reductase QueF
MFGKEHELNPNYTKQELIKELLNTRKELSLLHLKYAKLNSYRDKKEFEESKWGRIYKLIKERTPNNMEEVVERRINAMFNTNYEYQET